MGNQAPGRDQRLLTWSPELTWPDKGGQPRWVEKLYDQQTTNSEREAWWYQMQAGYSFGYLSFHDARNDAPRGVMEAIYAVHVFNLFLLTEHLR